MEPAGLVATKELASAEAFLSRIDARPELWPTDPRHWIFRGHADDRWYLVPAALRKDAALTLRPGDRSRGPRSSHREQAIAEHDLLRRFFRALDERGLPIPEDAQRYRSVEGLHALGGEIMAAALRGEAPWPPRELWSQLALAQHYGIPTRLLDWALSAPIATYFAAKRATERRARNEHVAEATHVSVWAMNARLLTALHRDGRRSTIELVTAPGASIPNMVGQRGVFTVHLTTASAEAPVMVAPHDAVLLHELTDLPRSWFAAHDIALPVLVRLRLRYEETPRLLRLLAYRGVEASLVYAGHQGAAEAVKEEALWDVATDVDQPGTPASLHG